MTFGTEDAGFGLAWHRALTLQGRRGGATVALVQKHDPDTTEGDGRMLDLVSRGYTDRLLELRRGWGLRVSPDWRGPGPDDRAMAAKGVRSDPPPPRRQGHNAALVFPRLLGRDYASNGGSALDAMLRAGEAAGLAVGEPDDGWMAVGADIIHASLGIVSDGHHKAPALPSEGVGQDGWYPFSNLSRHLDDYLRHGRTDVAGILITLGTRIGHAELVAACDCHSTTGGFIAGLIEGTTGKGWEDACWEAESRPGTGPSIPMAAYPMAVAAHLALQSDGFTGEYELPGFGAFSPRVPDGD